MLSFMFGPDFLEEIFVFLRVSIIFFLSVVMLYHRLECLHLLNYGRRSVVLVLALGLALLRVRGSPATQGVFFTPFLLWLQGFLDPTFFFCVVYVFILLDYIPVNFFFPMRQ